MKFRSISKATQDWLKKREVSEVIYDLFGSEFIEHVTWSSDLTKVQTSHFDIKVIRCKSGRYVVFSEGRPINEVSNRKEGLLIGFAYALNPKRFHQNLSKI